MGAETFAPRGRSRIRDDSRPPAVVEDMNKAMAWNIAGVGRRTLDAAEEAARRAGVPLDDWLDAAIAEHAAEQGAPPEKSKAHDDLLDAVAGRLERISRQNPRAEEPQRPGVPGSFDAAIERFEKRLSRAEARAARAFESVAQILERADAARDGDRQALLQAVRGLEAIKGNWSASAQTGEAQEDGLAAARDADRPLTEPTDEIARGAGESDRPPRELAPAPDAFSPKAQIDLKAAVSQIAMRRQELNARASRSAPEPMRPDPGTVVVEASSGSAAAPAEAKQRRVEGDAVARVDSQPTAEGSDAPPLRAPDSRLASPPSELLRDDVRALERKFDDMRRERASERACAVDVSGLRAEIAAMSRSLADLAPRNAVVALEGAIGDLVQRVEMMRQNGHGESLLAPLDAMAAELRTALKAHDPQPVAAGLEREIRAIGTKIDGLAAIAIKPETLERITRQTEEVRNLLASAALRTAPLERMERQIGELADRVDRLGASPAPHFESSEMAALLADARREIERSSPPAALQSIERRLDEIAKRLDQELARPAAAAIDSRPFDELARRIDGVRQSVEARTPALIDTSPIEKLLRDFDAKLEAAQLADGDARTPHTMFAEIRDKLDRLSDAEVGARWLKPLLGELSVRLDAVAAVKDLQPIETSLHALEAKLEAGASPTDRQIAEDVADEVARRLGHLHTSQVDAESLAEQIANIHDRVEALATKTVRAEESGAVARELLEKLRELDASVSTGASGTSSVIRTAFADLRAEQASAERRTQACIAGLQDILGTLVARLASIESDIAGEIDDALRPPARPANQRTTAASALPGIEALGPEVQPQRSAQSKASTAGDDLSSLPVGGEDLLLEPGAGAPQRAREARELAQSIGPKINPAISAHIAAARRAAQAAIVENSGAVANGPGARASALPKRASLAARSVENARKFCSSHKRTVLLGVALVIAATLAVRLVGVRAPLLQRSDLDGQSAKAAKVDAPLDRVLDLAGAIKSIGRAIDAAPTASIPPAPAKPDAPDQAPAIAPLPNDVLTTIPPEISQPLRDALAAGAPGAEYELALRLFEGRGAPKDQQAAVVWFQRAASHGLAPAQYRLGALYDKGIGAARDPAAAKRWYLKAAEAGNARAAHNLAVINAEPPVGEKPDYVEAAKWFRKAGDLGVRDSQFNLAILYARGLGVEQDLRQSWLWFSLAAQQGDADAGKKRDEVAAKMDPASLAAAADALATFKPVKQDPAANEVAAPPGGWDATPGSSSLSQSPPAPGGVAHP
jgi:localization factor PodJL